MSEPSTHAAGTVAIGVFFRNAGKYLREWLLFHTAAGVDYFYLYNNDSEDDFATVVAPWVRRGRAEVIDWPGVLQQGPAFDDCIVRARGRAQWLALLDDDEFLFDSRGEPLGEVLRAYPAVGGVAVSWYLYGTSGRIYEEPEHVIRRFVRRRKEIDQHHKCIVRPDRVTRTLVLGHLAECQPGYTIVDQLNRPVTTPTSPTPAVERLRINHYLTKSVMEMIARRTARDPITGERPRRSLLEWLASEKDWNMVEDTSAQQFLGRMEQLETDFPA